MTLIKEGPSLRCDVDDAVRFSDVLSENFFESNVVGGSELLVGTVG